MPTNVGNRIQIPVPDLDEAPDGPAAFAAAFTALNPEPGLDDQGVLTSRPVSTPGSPGIRGRYYFVTGDTDTTQNGRLWRDYGTGWLEIGKLFQRVAGVIASDGSRVRGVGFTVTHPTAGVYVITFSPAFANPPIVHATPIGAQDSPAYIDTDPTTSAVTIKTGSGNSAFHFTAEDKS
jgi:hypothetical protein